MDVKAIQELWGVRGSKNNPCSEMGPNLNLNLYIKKKLGTLLAQLNCSYAINET